MKYIKHTIRGKKQILILVQHGGNMIPVDYSLPEEYLSLEKDFGASELAHLIGKKMGLDVLEILPNRGILDCNRIFSKAVRNFEFEENLSGIYDNIISETFDVIEKYNFIVDLHTMSPHNQYPVIKESIDNIREYIESYTNYCGERRVVDIITKLGNKTLSDTTTSKNLCRILKEKNIPSIFNVPYKFEDYHMTPQYLKRCGGIAVDIPKDFLANGSLTNLKINEQKLDTLSDIFCKLIKDMDN